MTSHEIAGVIAFGVLALFVTGLGWSVHRINREHKKTLDRSRKNHHGKR